jgi:hypothetical protein
MTRLRSTNVTMFDANVATGANVIVDEVVGWCIKKLEQ